ncbi:hypothetical protein [Streptomyces rapamycinicus]|uniref:Uncharacterized protein n=2 Tax=Streptomyces rapamycinicus TaxID=1226757 RepID=A0A3L8QWQ1_STRRN|nr:hypothetical protein [Streptomyces rapamycinicus]MBB4787352.1 hypothetical protein [Streptomyces rapamycinicus]RLV71698.1 hypothetical protein D3C57_144265 [Streptomyces rapamycinicus NRRL 5491]UTP36911.1 hypothetical protein LIV37_51540 [Streptomyces rapamycinicus NRRL 5491]
MTRRLPQSYLALALLVLVGLEIPLGYFYAHGEESRFSQGAERDASMLAEVAEENIEKRKLETLPRADAGVRRRHRRSRRGRRFGSLRAGRGTAALLSA